MPNPLFFIALLPDLEIQQEVTAFKQECARIFGARHALNAPPHVTLILPFRWPVSKLEGLNQVLLDFAYDQFAFWLELDGFGCFRPRVLFVDVVSNKSLTGLQAGLQAQLSTQLGMRPRSGHGFHPHMTIAHRDLQESIFPEAWAHFSSRAYKRLFRAEGLALLRHEDNRWKVEGQFAFG